MNMAAKSIIERYTNCEVEIIYLTDSNVYRDRGILSEFDGEWLVLIKPTHEEFLIPVTAVRIVKVLAPPKDQDSILLRPAEPETNEVERRISSKP
jgi:hypothetical protein